MRSVLYLDFDNVFSALAKLDPKAAMGFAERPQGWLSRLAAGKTGEAPRRWLVLRCYLNPAGSIPHPQNNGNRLFFSKFRPYLADAGFEVVDCPRLAYMKNGADIRLVIDALDALDEDVRYEEFVIASGDSDLTPLLIRLRAADRRTVLVSPSDTAVVLGAVADRMIGGDDLLELIEDPDETLEPEPKTVEAAAPGTASAGSSAGRPLTEAAGKAKFRKLVLQRYKTTPEPMHLSTLAQEARAALGEVVATSRWFGYGGFIRAVQALDLPGVKIAHPFIWDGRRHAAPAISGEPVESEPSASVRQVMTTLKVPMLPTASWQEIYKALVAFVSAYEFNQTEATRWVRDRLVDRGFRANRPAVSLVAHGAAYGGSPLYRQPPPTATQIADAFVDNLLNRAAAADIELTPQETKAVRAWFGSRKPVTEAKDKAKT